MRERRLWRWSVPKCIYENVFSLVTSIARKSIEISCFSGSEINPRVVAPKNCPSRVKLKVRNSLTKALNLYSLSHRIMQTKTLKLSPRAIGTTPVQTEPPTNFSTHLSIKTQNLQEFSMPPQRCFSLIYCALCPNFMKVWQLQMFCPLSPNFVFNACYWLSGLKFSSIY